MNNDLINKALEQAKALQKTVGDALEKGSEQAHPLIGAAVAKAGELKDTLAQGAANASTQAQPRIEGAMKQLNTFISMGKSALDSGVAQAHVHLDPLADQLKKTVETTTAAMGKTREDADPK
ncbi:MAG: hypothetical protein NVSMB64_17980 [Candidatus Velthaea sp.]